MKSIIAAVDLSEISSTVFNVACCMAKRTESAVKLLHVLEPLVDDKNIPLIPPLKRMVERVEKKAELEFERFTTHNHPPEGVYVNSFLEKGKAFLRIIKASRKFDTHLVVMGAPHPRSLLGSTLGRVARKCPSPLLVTRSTGSEGYRRVVIGVDFSPGSEAAAKKALELARPDAKIELCHVTPDTGNDVDVEDRADAMTRKAEHLELWGREHLGDADWSSFTIAGDPRKTLVEVAAQRGGDLLAVGSHGSSSLTEMLLGSVAEAAARNAKCDVLICNQDRGGFELP